MHIPEQLYLEALEMVACWDLPDSAIAEAANQQAMLMAGHFNPDDAGECSIPEPGISHH